MTLDLLIIVTSDPRNSARPAEAIRIAAGVSAARNVKTGVYLHGPAVLALGSGNEDLVDSENFDRYLPLLFETPQRIMVQAGSPFAAGSGPDLGPVESIDERRLAAMIGGSASVLRF